MNKLSRILSIGAVAGAVALPVHANIIYTFNADGVSESVAQQATAKFDFASASSLNITLSNNVSPTQFVQSMLDGLVFSFAQAPTSIALTGVTPTSVVDCSNQTGTSCPAGSSPDQLFGWGTTFSGGPISLGSGFSGGTFGFRPYDIVNASFNLPTSGVGLSDPLNNPLLVGPVTFSFALTGLNFVPEVSSVTFLFGAPPPVAVVGVPEPGSLVLLGLGLFALAAFARKGRASGPA